VGIKRNSKFNWLALFGKDLHLLKYLLAVKVRKNFRELKKCNNRLIGTYASLLILKISKDKKFNFRPKNSDLMRKRLNCLARKLFRLSDETYQAILNDYE
jgi:hypothetical protein